MSLSSILSSFKKWLDTVWSAIESWARSTVDAAVTVWKDVKQWKFLENWNAAWQQAGSEAFDAMQSGKDQWFAKNLANVVTKAWAGWVQVYEWVKSGDGKAIQEWAQNLSETISAKPIAKLSWLLLPENSKTQKFLEWAAGWLDIYGNVIGKSWSAVEKFKKWDIAWGVIDTWFAALWALPFTRMATAIGASAIWWGLNATWASDFIAKEKWVGKEKLTNQLVSWWVDPVEAQRYAENTIEWIDLAAQALAMRYGMRVGNKIEVAGMKWVNPASLTMMDVIRHNAKNAAISGGIQTAPAAIYSIIDSANNPDGVKESAKALISNAFASAIPMPVSLKWKTGEQTTIPVENFMKSDADVSTPVEVAIKPIKWKWGKKPKALSKVLIEKPKAENIDFVKDSKSQYSMNNDFNSKQDITMAAEAPATSYTLKLGRMLGLTGQAGKQVSDRVSLDNVNRVLPDGRVVDQGNYLDQSWKNIANSTQKNIQEFAGYTRDALASVLKFKGKWNDSDFIGKTSPEWVEITPQNVKIFRETYNNIKSLAGKVSLEGFSAKDIENMSRASHIYALLRGDQSALDKYFTKEQQATLENLEANVKNQQGAVSSKMVEDQIFSKDHQNPDYQRKVMTYDNYKRIPKDMREPIKITLSDGTVRTFDNIEKAQSFVRLERARGKNLTPDMEAISSLSKDQGGAQVDPYRIHGAIPSMLSYIKNVGELYADTHTAKELNAMAWDKNVWKYIDDIRNNVFGDTLEARLLGLEGEAKSNSLFGKAASYTSATALGIPTYIQSSLSSTAKNLADAFGSAIINLWKGRVKAAALDIGGAIKATPWTLLGVGRANMGGSSKKLLAPETAQANQRVQQSLYNEGFISGYEVGEGTVGTDYIATVSGARQENAAKTDAVLRNMRRVLLDNGYKDTGEATSIIDNWAKFKAEKPQQYVYERNNVYNDSLMFGDMSRQARAWFLGAQRLLGPIKTFQTGLVSRAVNDARRIVDGMTHPFRDGTTNGEQFTKALYRTAQNFIYPAILYAGIVESLPDDMDKKIKDAIATNWQNRIWSNSFQDMASFGASMLDSVPVEKLSQLMKVWYDAANIWLEGKDMSYDQKATLRALFGKMLDDSRKAFSPMRDLSDAVWVATGKSGQEMLSEKLGTTNLEFSTDYGMDSWNRIDTRMERIMKLGGFWNDPIITNLLRDPEKITSPVDQSLASGMVNSASPLKAFRDAQILKNWQDSTIGSLVSGFVEDRVGAGSSDARSQTTVGERMLTKQSTYDVLTALQDKEVDNKDSVVAMRNFLQRLDIDPKFAKFVHAELNNRLDTIYKKNDTVEKEINTPFDPRAITSPTLMTRLQELHKDNPKWFNDFISWMAEFQQAEHARKANGVDFDFSSYTQKKWGSLVPDNPAAAEYLKGIKGKYRDSASISDQAIADYFEERSLTTSAMNQAFKAMEILGSQVAGMSETQVKDKLGTINKYLEFLSKNSNYTGNHLDAASLNTFDMMSAFEAIAKAWKLKDALITKTFPYIKEYIVRWLGVRGEDVPTDGIANSQENYRIPTSTPKNAWWMNLSTSPIQIPEWWILPDNKKKVKPKDLKDTYYKVPTTPQKKVVSLSEMLKR